MNFLTENEIRVRAPQAGGVLSLAAEERLTPSAAEYVNQLRLRVEYGGANVAAPTCANKACPTATSQSAKDFKNCTSQEVTYLDKDTVVPKSHPAIIMRGKLDSLLANVVLIQTQFDPKDRKPVFLKNCLADIHKWVMQTLSAEVSGSAIQPSGMGGMNVETIHHISREPKKYLGLDHFAAEASLGGNIALLNWLRALVRETEVIAVACSANMDVICSLNRLSSAVYVLMLLALAEEQGIEIRQVGK